MTAEPAYWMRETSGVLAPAVRAYLSASADGGELTPSHVDALRAYLRQWMAADWRGDEVPALRDRIGGLTRVASFTRWFAAALVIGIDPL